MSLQGYIIFFVAHILNKVSSKSVQKIFYEKWYSKPSSLNYLELQGCLTYVKVVKIDKLDAKSEKCQFIRNLKDVQDIFCTFQLIKESQSVEMHTFQRNNSFKKVVMEKKYCSKKTCKSLRSNMLNQDNPFSIHLFQFVDLQRYLKFQKDMDFSINGILNPLWLEKSIMVMILKAMKKRYQMSFLENSQKL